MNAISGQRPAQDLLQVNELFVCLFVNPNTNPPLLFHTLRSPQASPSLPPTSTALPPCCSARSNHCFQRLACLAEAPILQLHRPPFRLATGTRTIRGFSPCSKPLLVSLAGALHLQLSFCNRRKRRSGSCDRIGDSVRTACGKSDRRS